MYPVLHTCTRQGSVFSLPSLENAWNGDGRYNERLLAERGGGHTISTMQYGIYVGREKRERGRHGCRDGNAAGECGIAEGIVISSSLED